jgi:lysozyme
LPDALTISPTLLSQVESDLRVHEGVRSKPYRDTAGFLTIGVGHNLDASGLCPEAISVQLRYDIRTLCIAEMDRHLSWWRDQPMNVQRALVNLCFNLGIHDLLQFKQTLALIKKGDYREAAAQLLRSKYASQVKGRAREVAGWIASAHSPVS